MPYLNNSFIYQERLLSLIGRLNEKDCLKEINNHLILISNLK